ncbi:MAG: hypothetical protein GXO70_02565 [Acidobacteria bacterium]|nr:hypothetical protein [Acidobacteriota bacterium]
MKVTQKVSFLVIGIIIVVTGGIYFFLHEIELRTMESDFRTISFGSLTVEIPQSFGSARTKDSAGWHVSTFRNRKVGTFKLATAPASSSYFRKGAIRYFSMKRFPEHTAIYRAKSSLWFAKYIDDSIPGILVIRTRGKGRVFTYFFNYDNTAYWLSFSTGRSLRTYAALFFQVISSLKVNGQNLHGPGFQSELSSICREGYFIFCQPILFFLLLPISIVLLVIWLSGMVSKRMGRLPGIETLNTLQPFYTEENVSVFLKMKGKNQIMSFALTANTTGIQLFQFKRLFIEISRKKIRQWETIEGNGWFGGPYLQVKAPAEELVRAKQRLIRFTGMMTVRIYSDHPEMLHQYLT